MDPAYLSRVEHDHQQYVPNLDTLKRIVKALDLQQKDADGLFVAARKLPPDIHTKLLDHPQLFSRIRKASERNRTAHGVTAWRTKRKKRDLSAIWQRL